MRLHPLHGFHVPRHIMPPGRILFLKRSNGLLGQNIPMPPPRSEKGQMKPRGEIMRMDEIPSGDLITFVKFVEVGIEV